MVEKKKSLGQNFLHNPFYLGKIADAVDIKKGELVVEVGPGDGALTQELLKRGAQVIAIEKDRRLIPLLRERFAGQAFEVIEADALLFDISNTLQNSKKYKVVGNIPYYITGALLKKFLSAKHQPSEIVFLLQKEVTQRIARSKKESILSLSVKAYGEPRYVASVPRGAFSPPPKVDSAVLKIENISRKNFTSVAHEERFFELVRAGFAHKRKKLASNLTPLLGTEHSNILKNVGMSANERAEDVSLKQWLALAEN